MNRRDAARRLLLFVPLGGFLLLALWAWACGGDSPSTSQAPATRHAPAKPENAPAKPGVAEEEDGGLHGLASFEESKAKFVGALEPGVFSRIMSKHRSSLKVCYKRALEEQGPTTQGLMKVRFTISPTGRVSTVEVVSSTIPSPTMPDCVMRVVRRIQFPSQPAGQRVTVEYPLSFYP